MTEFNPSEYDPAAFEDPDDADVVEKFEWSDDMQRTILGLILCDQNFLIQSSGLVNPSYFNNEVHQELCRLAFSFFDKYKIIPKRLYLQEFIEEKIKEKTDSIKLFWRGEVNAVYDFYVPGVEDRDFLRDKILDFSKEQSIKIAFFNCLEEFKKNKSDNKWSKIHTILNDALTIDRDFEIGENYFEDYEARYERMMKVMEEGDIFTSGFHAIDKSLVGGGMYRGQIASWMGLSGSGKSLMLVKGSIANLNLDKKVLYISCELDQDRVGERFDAQLADPSNKHNVGISNLVPNRKILFEALEDYTRGFDDKRRLVIKHFPGGTLDIPTFRSYLKQIQMRGFFPDLVIIDYIGEMKDYSNMPTWESRFRIVRDLRGIASEHDYCSFTAMQPDKSARGKVALGELIDDDNLADAYGQVRPLDCLWTLNQRKAEIDARIGRGFVAKHRFGESRYEFWLEYDKRTLDIREIAQEAYKTRLREHEIHKETTKEEQNALDIVSKKHKMKNDCKVDDA
jgi:hypothetical protein